MSLTIQAEEREGKLCALDGMRTGSVSAPEPRHLRERGRGMMTKKWAGIACIVMLATGCAGPQLATSPVTASEEAEANRAMQSEALPPELRTSGVEQVEMVRRVKRKIRPATEKVCARTLDRYFSQRRWTHR